MTGGGRAQLLAIAPVFPPALAALEQEFTVHRRWLADDPAALLREIGPQVRGLVTTGLRGFGPDDIAPLPNLEIISCFGQSHGTLDLAAARARGIVVTNTPDWTEEAVADVALGLILGTLRRLCEADRFVRAGRWLQGPFPMSTDLRGKTCGVVGMGAIGRAVAHRAQAFGMAIAWHGPSPKPDAPGQYYPELTSLARDTDCLVVCCASTAKTRHMIDRQILAALGPAGYLINISRGAIVDQTAMIEALTGGTIAGAGLEVFEDEPHVPAELLAMEQVMLVPHLGSSTRAIRAQRQACLLASLRAHFSDAPVPNRVG
jgi:lactate dehydrogenase-like 2-hydroxyacid dehydrogenase